MNASLVTNGIQSNGSDVDGSDYIATTSTSSESASGPNITPRYAKPVAKYFLLAFCWSFLILQIVLLRWLNGQSDGKDIDIDDPEVYFSCFGGFWIIHFVVWIRCLVTEKRRVSRWRHSQMEQRNSTDSQNVNENLASQQDYKLQQHKEANSQSWLHLLLIMGASIGLALSIFANLSCDFVRLDTPMTLEWRFNGSEQADIIIKQYGDAVTNDGESLQLEFYTIGLWALGLKSSKSDFLVASHDACFNISSSGIWDMGWQFQQARKASVAASVLGGLSLLFLMTKDCFGNTLQRGYSGYVTLPFLFATILQSLTLFLLDTNYCTSLNDCDLGLGAVISISASFYWLLVTLIVMTPYPDIPVVFAPSSSPSHREESNEQ